MFPNCRFTTVQHDICCAHCHPSTTDSSSSARTNSGWRPADQFLGPRTSPPRKAEPSLQVWSPPFNVCSHVNLDRWIIFGNIKFLSTILWDLLGSISFLSFFVMPWQHLRTCLYVVILLMLSLFTKITINPQLTCCSAASRTRAKAQLVFLCSSYHSLVRGSSLPVTACPSNLAPWIRRWGNAHVWCP
jgi:hypothetical protein